MIIQERINNGKPKIKSQYWTYNLFLRGGVMDQRLIELKRQYEQQPNIDLKRRIETEEVRAGIRPPLYYDFGYHTPRSRLRPAGVYLDIYDSCPAEQASRFTRSRVKWKKYTIQHLRKRAKELNIAGVEGMTKQQLVLRLSRQRKIKDPLYSIFLGQIRNLKPKKYQLLSNYWNTYYSSLEEIQSMSINLCEESTTSDAWCEELLGDYFDPRNRPPVNPAELVAVEFYDFDNGIPNLDLENNMIEFQENYDLFVEENASAYKIRSDKQLRGILSKIKVEFDEWFVNLIEPYDTSFFHEQYNPYISISCFPNE